MTECFIDKIQELKKTIQELKEEIQEFTSEYAYQPDGEIAKALKTHFEQATLINKPN